MSFKQIIESKLADAIEDFFVDVDVELFEQIAEMTDEMVQEEAEALVNNKVIAVAEGANMPTTPEAIEVLQKAKVLFSPGKASNAGGVATSGLEMSQNSLRYNWTREEVDAKLNQIMDDIHASCVEYGKNEDGSIDYVKGANVAGFVKVADAMLAQGLV